MVSAKPREGDVEDTLERGARALLCPPRLAAQLTPASAPGWVPEEGMEERDGASTQLDSFFSHLASLPDLRPGRLAPNTLIVREEQIREELYFVLSGTVTALDASGRPLGTLGRGAVFGDGQVMHRVPLRHSYVAGKNCHVVALPITLYMKLSGPYPEVVRYVAQIAAGETPPYLESPTVKLSTPGMLSRYADGSSPNVDMGPGNVSPCVTPYPSPHCTPTRATAPSPSHPPAPNALEQMPTYTYADQNRHLVQNQGAEQDNSAGVGGAPGAYPGGFMQGWGVDGRNSPVRLAPMQNTGGQGHYWQHTQQQGGGGGGVPNENTATHGGAGGGGAGVQQQNTQQQQQLGVGAGPGQQRSMYGPGRSLGPNDNRWRTGHGHIMDGGVGGPENSPKNGFPDQVSSPGPQHPGWGTQRVAGGKPLMPTSPRGYADSPSPIQPGYQHQQQAQMQQQAVGHMGPPQNSEQEGVHRFMSSSMFNDRVSPLNQRQQGGRNSHEFAPQGGDANGGGVKQEQAHRPGGYAPEDYRAGYGYQQQGVVPPPQQAHTQQHHQRLLPSPQPQPGQITQTQPAPLQQQRSMELHFEPSISQQQADARRRGGGGGGAGDHAFVAPQYYPKMMTTPPPVPAGADMNGRSGSPVYAYAAQTQTQTMAGALQHPSSSPKYHPLDPAHHRHPHHQQHYPGPAPTQSPHQHQPHMQQAQGQTQSQQQMQQLRSPSPYQGGGLYAPYTIPSPLARSEHSRDAVAVMYSPQALSMGTSPAPYSPNPNASMPLAARGGLSPSPQGYPQMVTNPRYRLGVVKQQTPQQHPTGMGPPPAVPTPPQVYPFTALNIARFQTIYRQESPTEGENMRKYLSGFVAALKKRELEPCDTDNAAPSSQAAMVEPDVQSAIL